MSITFVYVWKPSPGNDWMVHEASSGITCIGPSREAAVDDFQKIWNFRSPLEWKETAPPPRPGQSRPIHGAVIDSADRSRAAQRYKDLMRRYHSDLHPGATYSADQIVAAINELWDAVRPKA